jgi:uncharacterized protein YcfJ
MNNKSLLIGAVIGVAVATAGGVYAGYKILQSDEAAPAVETSVAQTEPAPAAQPKCVPNEPRDKKRIAGTVVGALVGGAVGKDVGDRDITTAAGAAAGALAGNQIQKKIQDNRSGC